MRDKPGIHAMYGLETVGVRPVFVSPTHFIGGFNDSQKVKGTIC